MQDILKNLDIIGYLIFFKKIAIIFLKKDIMFKQKILYSVLLSLIAGMFAQVSAKTIVVTSLDEISTLNPPMSVSVELLEPLKLSSDLELSAGNKITGKLTNVVSPKRLKRNAKFSFEPVSYTDLNGEKHKLPSNIKASYTTTIDKKEIAKNTALGIGNYFVKGLSMGVAAIEGAVENEEGNRIKSSVVSVYESSPLSYVEKGQEICIKKGQSFYLKFPNVRRKKLKKSSDDRT